MKNKQDEAKLIESIISLIKNYQERHAGISPRFVTWQGMVLYNWEFKLLSEMNVIGNKGIRQEQLHYYSCFQQAKQLLSNRSYGRVNATPPPQE